MGRWVPKLPTLQRLALLLALGVGATVAVAWGSVLLVDMSLVAARQSGQSFDGQVLWNVAIFESPLATRVVSRRELGLAWSVEQACGPPDTIRMGDERTAWASATPDASSEWLELTYLNPVFPREIHIYESFNPGAIAKVTVYGNDEEKVVWERPTPLPVPIPDPGTGVLVLKVPVFTKWRVNRVRLDIDSPAHPGWNEIDAVGLQDASGRVTWADRARASSSYAGRVTGNTVTPILPYWSALPPLPAQFVDAGGGARNQIDIIEGRGWPMPALRFEVNPTFGPRITGPIWGGFAVDALVLAMIAWAFSWLLIWPGKYFVEASRLRRGCCMRCGYDLQFNLAAGCPECGWRRQ
jgi:hypothetical protein